MKAIVNFIAAVFLIEIGFYLFFGSNLNVNTIPNLNSYRDENLPTLGTHVELYIMDVGELFLTNDNYSGIMYDVECYYLVQINDGRFFVVKTSEGSSMDEKLSRYAEKYKTYHYFNKGEKPEIFSLEGKIDKIPELESESFMDYLDRAKRDMMQKRRYVRMQINDTVINVDTNVSGKSMNGVLKQSLDIVATSANALKKLLGVIVIFMGVVFIISLIKEILGGVTYESGEKNIILASDDVFKNISAMKTDWNEDKENVKHEETYDDLIEKMKKEEIRRKANAEHKDKSDNKEDPDKKIKNDGNNKKGFTIKKDG